MPLIIRGTLWNTALVPLSPPRDWPALLAGRWTSLPHDLPVLSPWDGQLVGTTSAGGADAFDAAAAAAVDAAPTMRRWPAHARIRTLRGVANGLRADREAIAQVLCGEAGKPIRDARIEVDRAAFTFDAAADEVSRPTGDVLPLDIAAHGVGRLAITKRVPLGPIAAITPFNFPLNLAAHKLAPALAVGNPIVLKPSTRTPLTALILARLLVEHGVPEGGLSVLPLTRGAADRLVTDPRFTLLTFTGSAAVGWDMKARAGQKRVTLELGGNAGVIVDQSANLDWAVRRVVAGGFTYAGQSCISVQRVYLHDAIVDAFIARLVPAVEALRCGDPSEETTDLGPMITRGDVTRIDQWVRDAVADGARVLTGGHALTDTMYAPTVMSEVPAFAQICREEVFAPLIGLYRVATLDDAIRQVNASRYGLQAGLFTHDLPAALAAFDDIDVGGLIINDVPSYRVDSMPYGGVKDSGTGREGPRYAMDEMSERRLLIINAEER
jgi:glyceraldehyde-3-phosphate dehydrogenase (NADP+)